MLTLETLESRLTPSQMTMQPVDGQAFVVPTGADYLVQANFNVTSLTEAPGATLTLAPGVQGMVTGGMSDVAGHISYQAANTSLTFNGGTAHLHGQFSFDPLKSSTTMGDVFLAGGVETTVNDATFSNMNLENGIMHTPGGYMPDSTSQLTFTGAADFTGYSYVDNYANLLFSNAGAPVTAQEVILDTGRAEVNVANSEVNAILVTSNMTQLEVLPGDSLNVGQGNANPWTGSHISNVYVATPNTVQVDTGASLTANDINYEGQSYGGGEVLVSNGGLGGFYLDPIQLQKLKSEWPS